MITITPQEYAILEAAKEWARAERALRDEAFDREHRYQMTFYPLSASERERLVQEEERRHRVGVACDYTEQKLLDACERLWR